MDTRGPRFVRGGLGGLGACAAALTFSACSFLQSNGQARTAMGPPEGFSVDLDAAITHLGAEGDVVLDLGTTATPEPNQPNGPRCGAGGYRVDLRVGADGGLEPQP